MGKRTGRTPATTSIGVTIVVKCSHCIKLKLKLDDVLSELSSAHLITELLQNERNCSNTDEAIVNKSCYTSNSKLLHQLTSEQNQNERLTVIPKLNPKLKKTTSACIYPTRN
jgi:hypothetical protein